MSGLLVSCTATPGPGFNLASPSYTDVGVASVMADVAQSEGASVVAESGAEAAAADPTLAENESGDAEALPERVALLPAANPASPPAQEPEAAKTPAEADGAETPAAAAAPATSDEGATEEATVTEAVVETAPKKRGFLASLFSPAPNQAAPAAQAAFAPAKTSAAPLVPAPDEKVARLTNPEPEEKAAPLIDLASKTRPVQKASFGGDALPGVRRTSLFEITHKSGIDDDSDVDLYEDVESPVVMASAAGLARLAPNGLLKQRESVDVACLKPELVRLLKTVERHYGKRMIITSGYRSPSYNRKVRGARRSQHMYCAAADVQIPGVSKWELAKLVRSMPSRGGVGTYCHTESVHIDVGPERDWNWRCRRRKS